MLKLIKKIVSSAAILTMLLALLAGIPASTPAHALVSYPPASLLQPNDITSVLIKGGAITPAKISTTNTDDFVFPRDLSVARNATTTGNQVISGNLTISGVCSGCASAVLQTTIVATTSLVLGDAIMAGTAATSTFATSTDATAGFTTWDYICYPGQPSAYAERFDAAGVGVANVVSVDLSKVGAPTGQLAFVIYKGDATSPSGNGLQRGYLPMSQLTTSPATTTITMASTTVMNESSFYWIAVQAEGSACDTSNYVRIWLSTANPWPGGKANRNEGGWLSDVNNTDLAFRLGFTGIGKQGSGNSIYQNGFIGFSAGNYATGTTALVNIAGAPSSFGSLVAGTPMYASSTPGGLSTVPVYGSTATILCFAISGQQCRIK